MDQGFTKPNRGAASWDSDNNANFTLIERGYVVPRVVATSAINTGQLVAFNASGFANLYIPWGNDSPPDAVSLGVTSPGNTGYFLRAGAVTSFTPWSGQLAMSAGPFACSVRTVAWPTTSLDQGNMHILGRVLDDGTYTFAPTARVGAYKTETVSGIAHAASVALGIFSFHLQVGPNGYNNRLRVLSLSCDNYRVSFFANSARTTTVYDTAVLSGNLSVRTNDLVDAALFPYSLDFSSSDLFGRIYGQVEVLSSAATAINSQAFSVQFVSHRVR